MDSSVKKWVSYGGLAFVVILIVAVFIQPSTPDTNATAARVVHDYYAHQSEWYFNAYAIVAAIIVGLGYFWYLREYLAQVPGARRLATVGFAGAIVFAVSGGVGAGMKWTLADASHSGNVTATTMQTLSVLQNDVNAALNAAGTAAFLIFTGIAIIRAGGLPRWLGWVGVVFGALSATGFAGPIGVGLWILLSSITVLVTGRRTDQPAAATTQT